MCVATQCGSISARRGGTCLCRFGVRVDSQHSVRGGVPRSTRAHDHVHGHCQDNELSGVHHVWNSPLHSARLAGVIYRFIFYAVISYLLVSFVAFLPSEKNTLLLSWLVFIYLLCNRT